MKDEELQRYAMKVFYNRTSALPQKITDTGVKTDVNNLNGLICAWVNKCVYYHSGKINRELLEWPFGHIKEYRNPKHEEPENLMGEKSSIIIARHPFRHSIFFL